MEINISKKEFWILIKPEIAYFNKKWVGTSEQEKRENEKTVLGMYYESLSFANEYALEVAFRKHRQTETTFPKIPQLVKHIPKASETYETPSYKFSPMPKNVAKAIKMPVVDDSMKLQSAEMIQLRYGTDFAECKKIVGLQL